MGFLSAERPTNFWKHSKICLKWWDLSYPAMLRTLGIPTLVARRQQLKLCREVGEGRAGGSCPPTFKSWGAQPLQFFTSLCAVVIVWLHGEYSPIIIILQYYNCWTLKFVINTHGFCNWVAKLPQLARSSPDPVAVEIRRYVSTLTDNY